MEQTLSQASSLCSRLAEIMGGKGKYENGICMVTVDRKDIRASIVNEPFHSLSHMFHIESPNAKGESLITGEMVLLEDEVPGTVNYLTNNGVVVSAIHTHWLFDKPKLIYIHFEDVTNPEKFAQIASRIIKK